MAAMCTGLDYLRLKDMKKDWQLFETAIAKEIVWLNRVNTFYGKAVYLSNPVKKIIGLVVYFLAAVVSLGALPAFDFFMSANRDAALVSLNLKAGQAALQAMKGGWFG